VSYHVEYTDRAKDDLKGFDGSSQKVIRKAIDRVSENPLPKSEGGYGTALGNKRGNSLTGLCRIKLLKLGVRVVYRVIREDSVMKIIVIAARADDEVYEIASWRTKTDKL
jgi:mRNA interferase RelE/StbE